MKAIIIAIGNELLAGEVVESNNSYLARRLAARGIEAVAHWTVGDDRGAIASAVRAAAGRSDVVLICGGLGPTADDVTREGLADALGVQLVLDEHCLAHIEEFFRRRGRKMIETNKIQAMFPSGTEPIENSSGTAPGIATKLAGAMVFVMPGVPHEMRKMYETRIAARIPAGAGAIVHKTLCAFGAGESDIGAKIADLMTRPGPVTIGTTVAAGLVSLRIAARGGDEAEANLRADEAAVEIRKRLGQLMIGEGEQTVMAAAVGKLLGRAAQTLSTAESCTGGLLGQLVTAVAGASDYYLGGFVCYSNKAKIHLLATPADLLESDGAVSEPVAAAMAEGCRAKITSDWAIAITGIAGPTGGTDEKPVGLVYVALAGPQGTEVHRHLFSGSRDMIRLRSALWGLNYLRLKLLG